MSDSDHVELQHLQLPRADQHHRDSISLPIASQSTPSVSKQLDLPSSSSGSLPMQIDFPENTTGPACTLVLKAAGLLPICRWSPHDPLRMILSTLFILVTALVHGYRAYDQVDQSISADISDGLEILLRVVRVVYSSTILVAWSYAVFKHNTSRPIEQSLQSLRETAELVKIPISMEDEAAHKPSVPAIPGYKSTDFQSTAAVRHNKSIVSDAMRFVRNLDNAIRWAVAFSMFLVIAVSWFDLDDIIEDRVSPTDGLLRVFMWLWFGVTLMGLLNFSIILLNVRAKVYRLHAAFSPRTLTADAARQSLIDILKASECETPSIVVIILFAVCGVVTLAADAYVLVRTEGDAPLVRVFTYDLLYMMGCAIILTSWYTLFKSRSTAVLQAKISSPDFSVSTPFGQEGVPVALVPSMLGSEFKRMLILVISFALFVTAFTSYILYSTFPTCYRAPAGVQAIDLEITTCSDGRRAFVLTQESIISYGILPICVPISVAAFTGHAANLRPIVPWAILAVIINASLAVYTRLTYELVSYDPASYVVYLSSAIIFPAIASKEEVVDENGQNSLRVNKTFVFFAFIGAILLIVGRTIIRRVFLSLYIDGSDSTRVLIVVLLHPAMTATFVNITHVISREMERTLFDAKADSYHFGMLVALSLVNRFYLAGFRVVLIQSFLETVLRLTYFHRRLTMKHIFGLKINPSRFDRVSNTSTYYTQFAELFNTLLAGCVTIAARYVYDTPLDLKTTLVSMVLQLLIEMEGDFVSVYMMQSVMRAKVLELWATPASHKYFAMICVIPTLLAVMDNLPVVAILVRGG